jgi:hypothetical protein
MKIDELIIILENKIKTLKAQRESASFEGNLDWIIILDNQIIETEKTLAKIKS